MRKIVLSIFTILMLCFSLSAQNQRVSGTVTDSNGEPLLGASVILKGTQVAAVTNLDGNYSLNVPANGVLTFQSLGYATQEVNVGGRTTINVVMESEVTELEQVIVIGYGSGVKPGTASGSISTVSSDIVKDKPSANVADALQGQIAGFSAIASTGEPGAEMDITIHGVGSLTSGTSPLFVIDGVPSSSALFTRLSSNDIENISVLKDASSTSIYGSRAANGVVYVVTKKGRRESAPSVRFNAHYGISKPTRNAFEPMGGQELLEWHLEFGEINIADYNNYKKRYDKEGDMKWFEWMFPNKSVYNVDFSVTGGSQTSNYFVSGSYMNEDGIAPRSYFERYTFRSNLDVQVARWMKMGTNLGLSYSVNSRAHTSYASGDGAFFSAAGMMPMTAPTYIYPYDEEGKNYQTFFGDKFQNPYEIAAHYPLKDDNIYIDGNIYFNFNVVKGLNIKSLFGLEAYDSTIEERILPTWRLTNGSGSASRQFYRSNTFTNSNTIEYKFDLGERTHNFTLLAGHEGVANTGQMFSAIKNGQVDDRMMLMANGSIIAPNFVWEEFSSYAYLSFFGRFFYNYKEKYFVDLTLRNDASSRFGRDSRNASFWSAGLVWDAKKEDFLMDNATISALTLRGSYGTQGNSDISNYGHLGLISSLGTYDGSPGLGLTSPGNPILTWENQKLFNVGFTLGLWNKLTLETSFYHRKTTDMLYDIPISATTGFTTNTFNIGEMVNQGVDIDLKWNVFKNTDWRIDFSTVFGYNHNVITELFGDRDLIEIGDVSACKIGHSYGEFYIYDFMGVDPRDGLPMYNDGNGNPTKDIQSARQVFTGKNRFAPYQGGFNIAASWKGISLIGNFSYVVGSSVIRFERDFISSPLFVGYGKPTFMRSIWRQPGDITNIPRYNAADHVGTTKVVESTSFLRLKNLTLSYDFPKTLMEKTGFLAGARVYFIGRNLLTFTPFTGYDPETLNWLYVGEYPMTRQYTFGVELTF